MVITQRGKASSALLLLLLLVVGAAFDTRRTARKCNNKVTEVHWLGVLCGSHITTNVLRLTFFVVFLA